MSQLQISRELFGDLLYYFFREDGTEPQGYDADKIRRQLSEKLDKIISRELFGTYKRTPSGAEREKARLEYLNHRGMPKSFRSDTEYHEPEPPAE